MKNKITIEVMKYAFLHKNFRSLEFEPKIIFIAHLVTAIFCFFPWLGGESIAKYRNAGDSFSHSAFSGPSFLIGIFIFLISVFILILFLDKLLDWHKVKLPIPERYVYLFASAEQIIFLILAWSVLFNETRGLSPVEIRFGIFVCFLVQVIGVVAAHLHFQNEKKRKARRFMQHPPTNPETSKKQHHADDPNLFSQ